jgi:hypothetical protein
MRMHKECAIIIIPRIVGKHLFWRMVQSDWLMTGQDFPVLPMGNTQFFYCPVRKKNIHKKL